MLDDVIGGILEILFHIFVKIICFYTGEIILFIITFGHKKPRWDFYNNVSATKWVVITEVSSWIGGAFWLILIIYLTRTFL